MRKSVQDDRIYVVKTLKSIDENGVTDILKRKQQTREVRKERRHRLQCKPTSGVFNGVFYKLYDVSFVVF